MAADDFTTVLKTLQDLTEGEFKEFRWHLKNGGIPACLLERADRQDTFDLMVHHFTDAGALKKTKEVLEQICRNDLVPRLPNTSSAPQADTGHISEIIQASCSQVSQAVPSQNSPDHQTGATAEEPHHEFTVVISADMHISPVSTWTGDKHKGLVVPVPQPRPITYYQQKLQSHLRDSFMCARPGWVEKKDEQHLDDIYTELYVTAGGDVQINRQHEVRQIEMARKATNTEKSIKPSDMFKHPSGKYRPIKTVLTNGIAGIGKTFLVHKFVLDWAEHRSNQDAHLIFPFTFRQLNPLKGRRFSLAELIHKCIPESVDVNQEALNHIFTSLQSSGNTNYDKSEFKLLFVFDGLDESRLDLDCCTSTNQYGTLGLTQSTSVDVLLTNLIKRSFLPSARLWITTRPAAADRVHSDFVDMVTEVRGFTDPQKEEYFRKRFSDEEQASRVISHIKTSRSLHIMCHIPVFCWITATVLEDLLKTREGGELPKTLTEMYTEFLVFQIEQTKEKYGPERCIEFIKLLAKLAYEQLEKGNLIFYEKDLKESGIDVSGASVCSGVFTEIFKEERGRKNKDKMFSFVHLSVQEFLAAVYVRMSLINHNKNVIPLPRVSPRNLLMFLSKTSSMKIHKISINRALQSPHGYLDLFLRFLLGLSLQTNQEKLHKLMRKTQSKSKTIQKTAKYIKKKISEDLCPERSINLFHCLNELNDPSLVEEIQQTLSSGRLSTDKLSPAQWSGLVFILLSSEKDLDVFDLKKYSASEEALLRLLPVVKASTRALLSGCTLSEKSCEALSSALCAPSTSLTELDLSNNDLWDSGAMLLCAGLENPHCRLETLRLSGCLITEEGCASLASALSFNPSHLRELDLRYNHPGESAVTLQAGLEAPGWRLNALRLEPCGEQWLKPGLRKYFCDITVDRNTMSTSLQLSDNNRKVTRVKESQPYPDHLDRFDGCPQLLCTTGLSGRCYWEVEWCGGGEVAVSYRGISRKGDRDDCKFGQNHQSWSLFCSSERYSVCHNRKDTSIATAHASSGSRRVAVFVDCPDGTLSFYCVSSDKLIHLHTFNTTFSEPLYPGFRVWSGSSMSLCSL